MVGNFIQVGSLSRYNGRIGSLSRPITSAVFNFIQDSFTAADGVLLNARTGENGTTWGSQTNWNTPPQIFNNNLVLRDTQQYFVSNITLPTSFEIEVNYQLITNTTGAYRILFNRIDSNNFYHLQYTFNGTNGIFRIERIVGGVNQNTVMNDTTVSGGITGVTNIRITNINGSMTVFINNNQLWTGSDSALTGGSVGLRTNTAVTTTTGIHFQNIIVRRIGYLVYLTPTTTNMTESTDSGSVVAAISNRTTGSTLSLVNDGGGRFALSGTNLIAGLIPTVYANNSSHLVTIRETIGNDFYDTSFTINVLPLLDNTTNYPSLAGAYSLRRLRSAYTGNVLRLRRSSDNAEQDIGFATSNQTRRNLLPNPTWAGTVIGNATPQDFTIVNVSGISSTVVATGNINGVPYTDIRFTGTSTAGAQARLQFTASNTVGAPWTIGQKACLSVGMQLVAGNLTGTSGYALRISERNSSGTLLTQPSISIATPSTTFTRFSFSTVASIVNCAIAHPELAFSMANGTTYDFTLRFSVANIEIGVNVNAMPITTVNTDTVVSGVGRLDLDAIDNFMVGAVNLVTSPSAPSTWPVDGTGTWVANNANNSINALTADTFTENTSGGAHYFNLAVTNVTYVGGVHHASIELKANGRSKVFFECVLGAVSTNGCTFDLIAGTASNGNGTIENLGNGWFRCTLRYVLASGQSFSLPRVYLLNDVGSISYTGDGVSGVLADRAQVQVGGFAPIGGALNASAFITTLYDQSGTARNVTQSTAANQPRIVNSGALETINLLPTIQPLSTSLLSNVGSLTTTATLSSLSVLRGSTTNFGVAYAVRQTATINDGNCFAMLQNGASAYSPPTSTYAGVAIGTTNLSVVSVVKNSSVKEMRLNNGTSSNETSTAAQSNITIDRIDLMNTSGFGGGSWNGQVSEMLFFTTDLSASARQTFERNQGAYYGITVA